MLFRNLATRGLTAVACLAVLAAGTVPALADSIGSGGTDRDQAMALMLLAKQTCALGTHANLFEDVAQATPAPSPSASPSPLTTPPIPGAPPGVGNGTYQILQTPRPQPGASAEVSPPPVPTPTPSPETSGEPIFLIRGGSTPPPITPAGVSTPEPSAAPTGAPTLSPGFVAVVADTVTGGTKKGEPGDATGNVHIYYRDEEIVGDKAHFDGERTVTITGHPFLINHTHDSILTADEIDFDTVAETAKLRNGNGETGQGVERGFVHFKADDLHTDTDGSAHGLNPSVTTCENPRAGYHITGKSLDVIPGDKIVISKAVLWLGAAAVFYLPKLVIPLRTVEDQRARPHFFPEVGYDSYEGAWIKIHVPFGKDQYYYGYYIVNYFTKLGLGVGYVGFYGSRRGRRTVSINLYGQNDRVAGTRTYNAAIQEQENFSEHLRGNFQYGYQSNYGALTNIPPNENLSAAIVHQTQNASQNYSYTHSSVGTQSSSNSYSITDTRQFNQNLDQAISLNMSNSSSNFGSSSFNASTEFDYLMHYVTAGADYQLEYDKTFSQQGYGINKIPEFQVRPYEFLPHFFIPMSAQLTLGEYSEPPANFPGSESLATWRGDAGVVFGPAIAKVWGSDFEATVNVDQYAYGTGDLKGTVEQAMSLTTPIGKHIVNALTYNEANYNGPALVPFQYLDQQPTENTKNAQDLIRFFNDDVYTASFGFSTNFDGIAQPISYQITAKPSRRSVVLLSGSFIPGPGQGFVTTNMQLSTPFGRDASIQFVSDLNWKGGGELFSNKIIYYTRTIGNCYQVQVLYSEASQSINVGLSLLAFPNQTATFAVGQPGSIIPSTFNF